MEDVLKSRGLRFTMEGRNFKRDLKGSSPACSDVCEVMLESVLKSTSMITFKRHLDQL